jgi:hypothetical protein
MDFEALESTFKGQNPPHIGINIDIEIVPSDGPRVHTDKEQQSVVPLLKKAVQYNQVTARNTLTEWIIGSDGKRLGKVVKVKKGLTLNGYHFLQEGLSN